ncbi:RrF2 family transcriptional regulator [Ihubacter sp. rT4E-8]|uniref:RrF2 family transcriptional regulator n=1 Tax=unclassified Ihubacter TaxID=2633299 RepID=UPI003C7A7DA2
MMKISTKGRYALRVMIDLAEHNSEAYIPLRDIARRQDISEKYLETIIPALTRAGFLEGLRGKGGGYKLTRPPESYDVASILQLTEGSLAPVACLEDHARPCPRLQQCKTLPMWENFYKVILEYFQGITLEDLIHSQSSNYDFII